MTLRNLYGNPPCVADNYQLIVDTLTDWGITLYTGVTGGGVIHLLKHLKPLDDLPSTDPAFLTLGEYSAGFVPLGYYLASGKIAAAVATTGAATRLITCGLSDAKLHDIPAVFIVPISGSSTEGFSPLQDTSIYGSNTVAQLRAEIGEAVFVLNDPFSLTAQLAQAKAMLDRSKPVVLVLDNEAVGSTLMEYTMPIPEEEKSVEDDFLDAFVSMFRKTVDGKRVTLLVGEEMARYRNAKQLTTQLCEQLQAAAIWSINGANAVSQDNPYGYGYISFGGNDKAMSLFNSLGAQDVLVVLGACPDEYTVNFSGFNAAHTFFLGNIFEAYGLVENSLRHIATGGYDHVYGPLDVLLGALISAGQRYPFTNNPIAKAPADLNDQPFATPREGYVNMAALYQRLNKWWPAHSLGIDDVCLAYKDRQYVTQRPNDNIHFYSLYRGSAMGGAFGAAVGAKLSDPDRPVFLFTGDGCFRLFSGSLGEVSQLGIVIFLLNNESLSIVEQGLEKVLPDIPTPNYHARIAAIDYCAIARACGWDAARLQPDLGNLGELLHRIEMDRQRSLLVEIPVDHQQELGRNPRLKNL
ncbi:thiamine pyrophosphate-binding protein [Chitinophaga polysaccharea]|uniref:thiamine pyrophosphate-dependent enzyme n=1 Tax=Chitinophaga polysaccharea TaxID=1293035 RepID=UPI001455B47F|nr:thiamine pyrophosphate-dependent enzyme [Chitinophaga polysaccharea]NLR60536.1 thiamine pyrophosphate-binding protein [Chitinophaga polysaccharea]